MVTRKCHNLLMLLSLGTIISLPAAGASAVIGSVAGSKGATLGGKPLFPNTTVLQRRQHPRPGGRGRCGRRWLEPHGVWTRRRPRSCKAGATPRRREWAGHGCRPRKNSHRAAEDGSRRTQELTGVKCPGSRVQYGSPGRVTGVEWSVSGPVGGSDFPG